MGSITTSSKLSFEYALGATVMICSFKGDDMNTNNIKKIGISYTYGNNLDNTNKYEVEPTNYWYINSFMLYIKNLIANETIKFTPYIIDNDNNYWQICNTITDTMLQAGNITYNILSDNGNIIANKMSIVINYMNAMGCNTSDFRGNTIPVTYNANILTASAYSMYTDAIGDRTGYGLVLTSGGSYSTTNTFFHELRHRYGINDITYTSFDKVHDDLYIQCNGPITSNYKAIHNALKFETGRDDAVLFIADAHSNAIENLVYKDDDSCYQGANMLKALIYYIDNSVINVNSSKTRITPTINIKQISTI